MKVFLIGFPSHLQGPLVNCLKGIVGEDSFTVVEGHSSSPQFVIVCDDDEADIEEVRRIQGEMLRTLHGGGFKQKVLTFGCICSDLDPAFQPLSDFSAALSATGVHA